MPWSSPDELASAQVARLEREVARLQSENRQLREQRAPMAPAEWRRKLEDDMRASQKYREEMLREAVFQSDMLRQILAVLVQR